MRIFLVLVLFVLLATSCQPAATTTRITLGPTRTPRPPTATPAPPTPPPTAAPTATAAPSVPEPNVTPTEAAPQPTATPTTRPGYFSRDQLIEDARQACGGHRECPSRSLHQRGRQDRLSPPAAPPLERYCGRGDDPRRIPPLSASFHRRCRRRPYRAMARLFSGMPMRREGCPFGLVSWKNPSTWPASLTRESRDLIGATLVSVEGVPLAELCERQRQLHGTENQGPRPPPSRDPLSLAQTLHGGSAPGMARQPSCRRGAAVLKRGDPRGCL